ncbi:MAG: hypothetical protein J6N95_02600 [Bacilli bacterium]|nr:hypothetical protein [Bacilli bacterium]
MGRLLKAFFYKLSKDLAFRIILIIGGGLALFETLIFFGLQQLLATETDAFKLVSGQSMLMLSFSPAQNFGLAIPLYIIIFVCLEFSHGTIRNKIIAGHSKFQIYTSLYLSGLILAMMLLLSYVTLCTVLGTIFGGFDVNGEALFGITSGSKLSLEYILKYILLGLLVYTSLVAVTVFFATLFRSIGPCIPIIFLLIMGGYYLAVIMGTVIQVAEATALSQQMSGDQEAYQVAKDSLETFRKIGNVLKVLNPLYSLSVADNVDGVSTMDTYTFFAGIGSNLIYAAAFFFGGAAIFKKRDIK